MYCVAPLRCSELRGLPSNGNVSLSANFVPRPAITANGNHRRPPSPLPPKCPIIRSARRFRRSYERAQPIGTFAGDLSQQLRVGADTRPRKLHLLLQFEAVLPVLSQHRLVFRHPAFIALDRIIFAVHARPHIVFSSRAAASSVIACFLRLGRLIFPQREVRMRAAAHRSPPSP